MYRFIQLCIICIICISPSFAKSIKELSFQEALELGIRNNPKIESHRLGLNSNKADIIIAAARPNPTLFSDTGLAENTYRVGLSYNFELGGKRQKRTRISESVLEKAEWGLEEKLLNFREELRSAYSALFYANENVRLRKELKLSYENLSQISKRREELGDLALVDSLQVETEALLNENDYKRSLEKYNQTHIELEYLLNSELDQDIELTKPEASIDLESLNRNILLEQALAGRPELKSNQSSQKIADQELDLAKTKRIPNLNLSGGPDIVTGQGGQTSAFFIAQIELPIFNRKQGEIESIKALQAKLNSEEEAERKRIEAEVKRNLYAYTSQKSVIEDYENKLLPKTKEYTEKRFRSFELGKAPIWVALDAQAKYINIQLEYIKLSLELQNTISSLERSIGVKINEEI